LYQLTLSASTQVTIDMRSVAFNTRLYLLSSSGSSLAFAGNGTGFSLLTATLAAGTYYIVPSSLSSAVTGAYTISINVFPALISISPSFAAAGTSMPVTLTGAQFSAPMTLSAGSSDFSNVTGSNVNVASSNSATATVSVPAGTPVGNANLTVATSAGSSNPASFYVFSSIPSISPGQTITGSLGTNDPLVGLSYLDVYQLVLNTSQTLIIDMKSTAFSNPAVSLMNTSGSPVANPVNSTGDSQLSVMLQPGTYYVGASAINSANTGAYTLSVNLKRVHGQITSQ
jgi:hypothetical protein